MPVANFVNQLLGRAQFSIKHVIGQAIRLVDYTADVERLREAVLRLGVRAETPDGGRVVEAVFDTAKELREFDRPVIVLLTDTHAEYSSLPAHHVLEELQRSGALLHVVAVARVAQLNPTSVPTAKDKPADLLEHQLDINRVLGDGPKQTGGRRVEIGGLGGTIPELQGVAVQLKQQYLDYLSGSGRREAESEAQRLIQAARRNRARTVPRRSRESLVVMIFRSALVLLVAATASAQTQPAADTSAYQTRCASCHGAAMTGGSAASILTYIRYHTDAEVTASIRDRHRDVAVTAIQGQELSAVLNAMRALAGTNPAMATGGFTGSRGRGAGGGGARGTGAAPAGQPCCATGARRAPAGGNQGTDGLAPTAITMADGRTRTGLLLAAV